MGVECSVTDVVLLLIQVGTKVFDVAFMQCVANTLAQSWYWYFNRLMNETLGWNTSKRLRINFL